MPNGYIGNPPKQVVRNDGVHTLSEVVDLQSKGHWGGSMEHIETQTISGNVAQVDFDEIKEAKYGVHRLDIINAVSDSDDKDFSLRVSVGGTFDTDSDYHRALQSGDSAGGVEESYASTSSQMDITLHTGNATNEKANSWIYIFNAGSSATETLITHQSSTINVNGAFKYIFGGGCYDQTAVVDGFRIFMDGGGNIASGVFKLYGIKQL